MTYDEKYFSDGDAGSTRSAKIIVPLLIDIFSPRSVLDLGCGTGSFIKIFQDLGVRDVFGVDIAIAETGLFHLDPSRLVVADLTHPIDLGRRFDLVICLEVAEHLPPEDAETLVDTIIRHGDRVCFSAAIPQQEGVDHVNCQWPVYWSALFADKGYVAVDALRAVLWNKEVVEWWYRQNTILYIKRERFHSGMKKDLASIAPRRLFPLSLVHPRHYEYKADVRHNLAGQFQRTQAELALSREELAKVNMGKDNLAGQVQQIQAEQAVSRGELANVSAERDGLAGQVQQIQAELAASRGELANVSTERDSLAGQVQQTQADLALSRIELVNVSTERDGLAGQVQQTQADLAVSREELAEASTERDKLAGQVQQIQAELGVSREELDEASTERDKLARQVQQIQAELALSREELTKVSAGKDTLTGQLQQAREELALSRKDVDTILRSRSWRMTRPLRITMDWIRERNGYHAAPSPPSKQNQEAKTSNDLPIATKREYSSASGMISAKGTSPIRKMLSSFVRANYGSLKRLLNILPKEVKLRMVQKVMDRFPELCSIAVSRHSISVKGAPNPVRLNAMSSDSRQRVLVIEQRLPTPDMTSSSMRLQAMLELIVDLGYRVTFVSNALIKDYHWVLDDPDNDVKSYEHKLAALDIPIIYGPEAAAAHLRECGESYGYAVLVYPRIMYDYSPLIRAYCPNAVLIYDTVDLHGLRYMREYDLKGDAALMSEANYYNGIEAANIKSSDIVIAITPDEAEKIRLIDPQTHIAIIPNLHEVEPVRVSFSARDGLMFIGHYLHSPNEDAVIYFVSDILPLIAEEIPDVKFYVCGSRVTDKIKRLADHSVQIVGYVGDPAEYFRRARVFVAPLRYGAGMKGKIGQSMSFGLPVVTTAIGAEGMRLVNEESALIADKPEEFARHVLRLYRDERLWSAISKRSQEHIRACFSRSAVKRTVVDLFDRNRMAKK